MPRIRNANEVLTGVFLCLAALFAVYLAWPLSSGTDVGIGPGFIPKFLALIQLILGGMLIAHGFVAEPEPLDPWQLRPLVFILASLGFFAMTIERMGLVIALTGLVLIGCAANREMRLIEALALAAGSVIFCILVFVKGLKLSARLWPALF